MKDFDRVTDTERNVQVESNANPGGEIDVAHRPPWLIWGTSDIGAGPHTVANGWQIGDIDGDGRDEIVQLWNNNGRLGVLVYHWNGSALGVLWSTNDLGAGSNAVG